MCLELCEEEKVGRRGRERRFKANAPLGRISAVSKSRVHKGASILQFPRSCEFTAEIISDC
jgi:hypothetical protein